MTAPIRIDIRQLGGGIDEEKEDEAIHYNPRAAYFPSVAPENGYEYGRYGSTVCKVPYTLHKDYGGELLDEQIRERLMTHMASGEYPVIRWSGVIPEWVSLTALTESVRLIWYRENPDYKFKVYWSLYLNKGFVAYTPPGASSSLLDPVTYGNNQLVITGLDSGVAYFYYIVAVSPTGIESPKSVTRGVRVR